MATKDSNINLELLSELKKKPPELEINNFMIEFHRTP